MSASSPNRGAALVRRGWLLWAVTFAVMLALTAAVPLLYLPLARGADERDGLLGAHSAYHAVVGLGGLVLLFVLYTILRQRELNAMRVQLEREEQDKLDVRTRLSELSALFQVSTTLNLHLRLDVILEIIVRRVVSTMRAQQASIMIYDPESGLLETRASYGLESEFARNARKRLGEGIAGWVAERNEPVQLDGRMEQHAFSAYAKSNRNITSALSLPLRVGERCVGVLNVNRINHPETFRDHHRDMLQMFAEHVGAVIERAEMMERLGKRNRELEADNEKLHESARLKDVFLSAASHELKTPLTSVMAYAELLDDNETRLSPDQRSQFLGRLRAEAARLMGLIDQILDLTRLESGRFVLRRTALGLNGVVRAAVDALRGRATRHGVAIELREVGDDPAILADEVKVRQSISYLLDNAIRFSPDGSTIAVATAIEDRFAVVTVTDAGPGIPPEEAAHVFELFGHGVREDAARGGGLGIGLHLVQRVAELHGGHVGVNSAPGGGSSFWVRLPLEGAAAAGGEAGAAEAA